MSERRHCCTSLLPNTVIGRFGILWMIHVCVYVDFVLWSCVINRKCGRFESNYLQQWMQYLSAKASSCCHSYSNSTVPICFLYYEWDSHHHLLVFFSSCLFHLYLALRKRWQISFWQFWLVVSDMTVTLQFPVNFSNLLAKCIGLKLLLHHTGAQSVSCSVL